MIFWRVLHRSPMPELPLDFVVDIRAKFSAIKSWIIRRHLEDAVFVPSFSSFSRIHSKSLWKSVSEILYAFRSLLTLESLMCKDVQRCDQDPAIVSANVFSDFQIFNCLCNIWNIYLSISQFTPHLRQWPWPLAASRDIRPWGLCARTDWYCYGMLWV